jgi:hypothetical protein
LKKLFNYYSYDFTKKSKNYIDSIVENEYENIFKVYKKAIFNLNKKLDGIYFQNKINSPTNKINIIYDYHKRYFNLLVSSITIDRIIEKNNQEMMQVDVFKEELNLFSRYINYYAVICNELKDYFKIEFEEGIINFESTDSKFKTTPKYIISRFLLYDFKFLFYKLISKSGFLKKGLYLSFGSNLLKKEIETELFKYGYKPILIDNIFDGNKDFALNNDDSKKNQDYFNEIFEIALNELNEIKFFFKNQNIFRVYVKLTSKLILESVLYVLENKNFMRNKIKLLIKENPNIKVCISNGLFNRKGILLYDALNFNNISVLACQHGLTAGNAKSYLQNNFITENNTSDTLFCYNKSSVRTRKKIIKSNSKLLIVGGPKFSKQIFNRKLLRLFLKLRHSSRGKQFLYLSFNIEFNSGKGFPYTISNSKTFKNEKSILKILSKSSKKIIYKGYPTKQYLFDREKELKLLFGKKIKFLNNNIDFRYIRPLFDVIITNATESTLEWCIGSNVPIIFLYSRNTNPLESKSVENIFENCFIFFDADSKSGLLRFKKILSLSYRDILKIWNKKQKYRDQYDEEYFLSKKKEAGKIGANLIFNEFKK